MVIEDNIFDTVIDSYLLLRMLLIIALINDLLNVIPVVVTATPDVFAMHGIRCSLRCAEADLFSFAEDKICCRLESSISEVCNFAYFLLKFETSLLACFKKEKSYNLEIDAAKLQTSRSSGGRRACVK